MAIRHLALTCDFCGSKEGRVEEFEDTQSVLDAGWFVLQGPSIIMGSDERVYCDVECLKGDLL